jgi:hypothetical protein
MPRGTVHIPWYATFFRGDRFEQDLVAVAPTAMRYGARDYAVYRSRDDRYSFVHTVSFDSNLDYQRWYDGPEMIAFREEHAGWYQVPLLPVWHDVVSEGIAENAHDPGVAQDPVSDHH